MRLPREASPSVGRPFIDLGREIHATILQIVKEGWAQAQESPEVNVSAAEVPMTEKLRDGMRLVINRNKSISGRRMIVPPGTESRSRPDVPSPDGRTDIPIFVIKIFFRLGDHDPHAIIECKRISGDDRDLCRKYVVYGIDRFREGKYAGNHSAAFMIGYLIAGNAADAAGGINRYLNSERACHTPRRDENLERSKLINEPWVWQSRHPRADESVVVIHHSFLSICR